MKVLLPSCLTLAILLLGCKPSSDSVQVSEPSSKGVHVTLDNRTVGANLPAGTIVGNLKISEDTEQVWLPGIRDVTLADENCFVIVDEGELWVIPCGYKFIQNAVGKSQDSKKKPHEVLDIKVPQNSTLKIFDSGIKSVASWEGGHLFIKNDGSMWLSPHYFWKTIDQKDAIPFQSEPIQLFESGIRKAAINWYNILALSDEGTLWSIKISDFDNLSTDADPTLLSKPKVIEESGVSEIAAGKQHSVYLKEDGSLWRWTHEKNSAIDYGVHASMSPVQIVPFGVTSISAQYSTNYILEDGSFWAIGIDPSTPSLIEGNQVTSAHANHYYPRGVSYLKRDKTLWSYSDLIFEKVHPNIQRYFTGSRYHNALINDEGELHFWAPGHKKSFEFYRVNVPFTPKQHGGTENHLFEIRGNQLVTRQPLSFQEDKALNIQISSINSSGIESQKRFEILTKDIPRPPTGIRIFPKAELNENAEGGTIVGQLYGIDPNENDKHTFELVSRPMSKPAPNSYIWQDNSPSESSPTNRELSNVAFRIFAIREGPQREQILIVKPSLDREMYSELLDFERHSSIPLYLRVKDSSGLSFEQELWLRLKDLNEVPAGIKIISPGVKEEKEYHNPYITPGTSNGNATMYLSKEVASTVNGISENLQPGSTVGELTTEVRDEKDELKFTLAQHPSGIVDDNHLFEIVKQSTGQSYLMVAPDAHFNHRDKKVLIINMRVQDQLGFESMEQVQLEVKPGFEVDLEGKVVTSTMKPGDLVGKFSSTDSLGAVRLTGIIDVAYNREEDILILKGDGEVLGIEKIMNEFSVNKIITNRTKQVGSPTTHLFNEKMPWRLQGQPENFSYSSSGIYRFEVLNSQGSFRKYETTLLPIRLEELRFSEKRMTLMHIPAYKVQDIAISSQSVYFIKDDGTLWRWETSGQEFAAPEQIRTNPSTLLPEGTFNTFFRIFGDELRLAKPIPEGIHEMKIHVTATNGEGLRIEEVFTIQVEE